MQPSDYGLPNDDMVDADDDYYEDEDDDTEHDFKPELAVLTAELKK